jgi:AAA domain
MDDQGKVTTRPPTLADVSQFHEAIERTKARLLIVDVLMAYLPSRVNSHRDQDIRAALHRIAETAETTGCTVLLLRHLNKSQAKSPIYRGGGSIGIVGAARAGYIVGPDPDDDTGETRVLACIKNNLAAEPPSLTYRLEATPDSDAARVVWGEASQHSAADLLRTANTGEDRTERNKATEWLRKYLTAQGRAKSADTKKAAPAAGFTDRTIGRHGLCSSDG